LLTGHQWRDQRAGKPVHKVALDFMLKDFDVDNFGTPSCSVTMKVSPIHGKEFEHLLRREAITGSSRI